MKKISIVLLVGIVLLFNYSCSYEFSEDSFTDIELVDPTANLSLNDFVNDVVLTAPVNVDYTYNGNNRHRLFEIKIFIDDVLIKTSQDQLGSFYIDADNLSSGNHILKIEYIFSSGSGSLADASNLEAYIRTDLYQFSVDKSIASPVVLTNVEISDGTIFLRWEPLIETNFDNASLIIKSDGIILEEVLLSNQALNSLVYNDTNSVRNNLNYTIKLSNRYNQSLSNSITLSFNETTIEDEITNRNQYKLTWTSHPLYNNFDYFLFEAYDNNELQLSNHGGEIIITIPDDIIFGRLGGHSRSLLMYRGGEYINHGIFKILNYGKSFEKDFCTEYTFSTISNSYFSVELIGNNFHQAPRDVYIHRLDPTNLTTVQSEYITTINDGYADLTIDPFTNDLILDLAKNSYLINSTDFSVVKQWNIIDFISNTVTTRSYYRNNVLIVEELGTVDKVTFFDATTKAILYTASTNINFHIADNGRYFYNNEGLYEFIAGSANFISSIDFNGGVATSVVFMTNQNKCVYSNSNQHPVIFDFDTQTKTVLNAISNVRDTSYDQKTNKILFFEHIHPKSMVELFDLSTQNIKYLEVDDKFHTSGYFYRYLNGKLIYSGGLYLDKYLN